MRITAELVTSAARAADVPDVNLPEIALVGRSNVGKSSLINALVRTPVARTSARPGKTRLANVYRVQRGSMTLEVVDLPGYGYARGGSDFEPLTRGYFERAAKRTIDAARNPRGPRGHAHVGALLLVDARHPGLETDVEAWHWLEATGLESALVATKIDKLARGQRIRAFRELESVFEDSVLPVSAATGEGLDELWKLMLRLANRRMPRPNPPILPAREAAAPLPTR